MRYSAEFKGSAVQKYLSRGDRTVREILHELGITSPTIYQWRDEFASVGDMKKASTPQSRSVKEKINALIEFDELSSEKRGEYLRKKGLHEVHLNEWRNQIEEALSPRKRSFQERRDLLAAQKKVKQLEKELFRKEKALAEASALLILKKKANLIWGTGEDE